MIKELQNKTDIELGQLICKLKIQLLELRFKAANGELETTHTAKEIRKTIANAMTVLSQRNVKVSFTTHSTQLIKTVNNKQVINSINNASLISSVVSQKAQQTNKKKSTKVSANKTKTSEPKKQVNNVDNKKNKVQTKPAIKSVGSKSTKKQSSVQIRKTAKG